MSKVQILRALLKQRLPADDEEEIFELFERTAAEYEEELCRLKVEYEEELRRLKEENERQRKLLDAVFNPEVRLHKTDAQQLFVKEEVSAEQQESTCSLGQSDHDLHHIKNEEEELWISKEREHLQLLEADAPKCEYDVKPQTSHCHQQPTEENREVDLLTHIITEQLNADSKGPYWGGPELTNMFEQDTYSHPQTGGMITHAPEPVNNARGFDWGETTEPESCLYSLKNNTLPVCDRRANGDVLLFSHMYDQMNTHQSILVRNTRSHIWEKPFSSFQYGQTCHQNGNPKKHTSPKKNKPFSCSECGYTFRRRYHLKRHMMTHTGEKPFKCYVCDQTFSRDCHLKRHMMVHTREKPFKCYVCGEAFCRNSQLKKHMMDHTV